MEYVDILELPTFTKNGITKPKEQAWEDGDWIGTFNLWILQSGPKPAIVYQRRNATRTWGPNLLDVAVGGHLSAGETIKEGLREVKEEVGKEYAYEDLTYLGKKLNISFDEKKRRRNNVVEVFMIVDNDPLSTYTLQELEVSGIYSCPIDELIKVHTEQGYSFTAQGFDEKKQPTSITVTKKSFPYNWDNYHFKMALLAKRFFEGEKYLVY